MSVRLDKWIVAAILFAMVMATRGFKCPANFPCSCFIKTLYSGETERMINCSHRGLDRVPSFVQITGDKIGGIDLSWNKLRALPPGEFAGLTINWIKFNNNPLKTFDRATFRGIETLDTLLCKNCCLNAIPELFGDIPNLRVLDLENNNITKIPLNAFKNAKLEELYIGGGNPLVFNDKMFDGLGETLQRISLFKLFLRKIPQALLSKMPNLKRLDFGKNLLQEIKKDHINQLPKLLFYLDFSGNPIKKIESGSFDDRMRAATIVNESLSILLNNTELTGIDFLPDPCIYKSVFMPVEGSPINCTCDLYRLTKNNVLDMPGTCGNPRKYRKLKISGDNSFSSKMAADEYACPRIWPITCGASLPSLASTAVIFSLMWLQKIIKDLTA